MGFRAEYSVRCLDKFVNLSVRAAATVIPFSRSDSSVCDCGLSAFVNEIGYSYQMKVPDKLILRYVWHLFYCESRNIYLCCPKPSGHKRLRFSRADLFYFCDETGTIAVLPTKLMSVPLQRFAAGRKLPVILFNRVY